MYPLFETVCIKDGEIQNRSYHEARFLKSYHNYYNHKPGYTLFEKINPSLSSLDVKHKLKIQYNENGAFSTTSEYLNKIPTTLQLVIDDSIQYHLKFHNRKRLDTLHQKKQNAADVLIVKNGLITDASYANIIFKNDTEISTPKTPLLKGTCRARLIDTISVLEKDITLKKLSLYSHFQLINAMNDFDENRWVAIEYISTTV